MMRTAQGPSKRGIALGLVILLLFGGLASTRFFTDVLWFREVGFSSVLFKSIWTQLGVGAAVGFFVGFIVWLNLLLAARLAPPYRISRFETEGRIDPLERYREMITPYMGWLRFGAAFVVAILAGLGASTAWQRYLMWANREPFGVADPQFGRDVGFYVFELPFLTDLLDWAWFAVIAALLVSAAAHYFHGSIRPEAGLQGVSAKALAHLSVLLGCLALIKAGQYYLGTFELNFSPRGTVTGASYTDVNAQLPALQMLAIISIVSALLFIVNIRFRTLVLPLAAVGIWVLTAVLAGTAWPMWVQRFSVDPQELQRETPYIQRNLEATREGFGLTDVSFELFPASPLLQGEDLEANETLLANVRLWDPGVLQLAYSQLQALRTYYSFEDVDVDRYVIDGQLRQVLLSARELSLTDLPENSRTWSNLHLQFTHGYGIVASLGNDITSAGQPEFLVKDVPGDVIDGAESLDLERPAIYFGESFQPFEYSVVNSDQEELDYPTEDDVVRSRYEGVGGIQLNSMFRRVAFAIREFDPNLVLSGLIRPESRILIYRNVRDRVLRAAPFLALDNDPYPAVIDGEIKWILDAYTTTSYYPYGQRFDLGDIVEGDQNGSLSGRANYIRNSVKVVVDAYDGVIDFYIIDETDPLIRTWRNAFPDLFTDEEPSMELREHFRYPEDLFKIQSEVYLTYHMETPENFYAREDEWTVPPNPAARQEGTTPIVPQPAQIPPTYLVLTLPGQTGEEFVITRPFNPRRRNNMNALMVGRADPANYGELKTFIFPRQRQVPGPLQVDNVINQNVEISQTLTLLRQGGSRVDFGSLVILPIVDSILYIQPIFVTADNVGIPELKRTVVVFGEQVVMRENFELALAELFQLEAPGEVDPEEPGDEPGEVDPDLPVDELRDLVEQAADVYDQAQAALSRGDFAEYGRLIEELGRLLQRAQALRGGEVEGQAGTEGADAQEDIDE